MKPIGGYFELELRKGEHYHNTALRLNSARNCLEYILRARRYKKIYIPYYTCEAILQPLNKLQIEYAFYSIDEYFELEKEITLLSDEALLYTNYYALKQDYVSKLAQIYGNQLIVDNAQAFFAPHINGIDTFYSPRKFFGIADGGYLYTDMMLEMDFQQDVSYERMQHLLKRIDEGATAGYDVFRKNDAKLDNQPIRLMSKLTEKILGGIDYEEVRKSRWRNYRFMHKHLGNSNQLKLDLPAGAIPMIYPYLSNDGSLRSKLISEKVFVAKYWPNVLEWCNYSNREYQLCERLIALPIDQRYTEEDMCTILNKIKRNT